MRTSIILLGAACTLLLALALGPCTARETPKTMRIGLVNTLAPGVPTGLLASVMRPFRSYMEETTGTSGEIVRNGDAFDLAKQMQDEKIQVGIFHGHEFAWAKTKHPSLEPIVVCLNQLRTVRANLVVGPKSTATTYADLEGKTMALPKDNRDHCRLYFEHRCVKPGVEPGKFYGRLSRPADTDDALDELATGRVQGAVIDAYALDRYKKANAARGKQLRVVQESETFPPGVIAYYSGKLAEKDVKNLREALMNAKNNTKGKQTLQILKLASFETTPEGFAQAMKDIIKAYPAPETK